MDSGPGLIFLLLAGVVACSLSVLLVLQSRLTFIGDDWEFLLQRRGLSAETFLRVHTDHIVVGPVAIYKALLAVFGMSSALPFQVVSTLIFVLSAVVLFAYVRRRVGDWPALLASTLILFLGAAWNDLLWSFQVGFSGSIAAGIGALIAVQRNDTQGDLVAAVLLVLSTSFSELGVSFALGVLVSVGLSSAPWRRLYVALVPLALYGIWYLGWGQKGIHTANLHNLVRSPEFVFDLVSQNLASLLGLATPLTGSGSNLVGLNWGRILLLIALVLAILRLGRPSRQLWTVLAAGGSFWFLTALNAYPVLRTPASGRYQYPGAVFLLLIGAELLRGVKLGKRLLVAATAVTAAAAGSGLFLLHDGYLLDKTGSDLERAELAAAELGRGHGSSDFQITFGFFAGIDARAYLSAVDAYGSPAFSESQLAKASEPNRVAADGVLATAEQIKLTPASIGEVPPGRCERSVAGSSARALGPGTYRLQTTTASHVGVAMSRFADLPSVPLGSLPPGATFSVTVPTDHASRPWRLFAAGHGALAVCRTSAP